MAEYDHTFLVVKTLLFFSGVLEPLQYDFYVFSFNSPLTFELSTHAGDADLYVTQGSSNPTYYE